MTQASHTIGNETRDFTKPRNHTRTKPRRLHGSPLRQTISQEAKTTSNAKHRLFLALLQSRDNCRPLMRKHEVFNKRGKDGHRHETLEQNRVQQLLSESKHGQVNLAMAVEFLGRLKTYTGRREIVPFFLRGVVSALRSMTGDQNTCLRLMRKASELEILANQIDQLEGEPNKLEQLTEKSAIQQKLEDLLDEV